MTPRKLSRTVMAGIVVVAFTAAKPLLAQQVNLFIGYNLPDNPDQKHAARSLEANALSQRNIEIQACTNARSERDRSECERQAEIAFRRRLAGIPGSWFNMNYDTGGTDRTSHWVFELTPFEAVDARLDQVFQHLQSGFVSPLGLRVDLGACQLVRTSDGVTITYDQLFTKTACALIRERKDVEDRLWDLAQGSEPPDAQEMRFLLDHVDHYEWIDALLPIPSQHGHTELVKLLLDHGSHGNARHGPGRTALLEAVSNHHANVGRLLLDHGADVNAMTDSGETALLSAAWGDAEVVKMLVDRGADVNLGCPLTHAASGGNAEGHADIVRFLLDHGASVNCKDRYGWTALLWASAKGGADVAAVLLKHGADVYVTIEDSVTPLVVAAEFGSADVASLLLDNGVDVRGHDALTALLHAASIGRAGVVKLLLDRGASVNAKTDNGWTALMSAAESGATAVVTLLVNDGADVNAMNSKGETAVALAEKNSHANVMLILRQHGGK